MDCSLPGSPIHGIFQAKMLEWIAISFSRRSLNQDLPHCRQTLYHQGKHLSHQGSIVWKSKKVKVKSLSHVQLFVTLWTVTCQAPLPMGFSRQECWSGLPFPSPGNLPDPWTEPMDLPDACIAGGHSRCRQILYWLSLEVCVFKGPLISVSTEIKTVSCISVSCESGYSALTD